MTVQDPHIAYRNQAESVIKSFPIRSTADAAAKRCGSTFGSARDATGMIGMRRIWTARACLQFQHVYPPRIDLKRSSTVSSEYVPFVLH